jgi:hypothetical protein
MSVSDVADRLSGIVHEGTQVRDDGVDLTVASVAVVADRGRVDFGGGELAPATLSPLAPERRHPDDDYGWWDLDEGTYVVEYNEALAGDDPVSLRPREELLEAGGGHPTLSTSDPGPVPLTVARGGLSVKENARLSTVRPLCGSERT